MRPTSHRAWGVKTPKYFNPRHQLHLPLQIIGQFCRTKRGLLVCWEIVRPRILPQLLKRHWRMKCQTMRTSRIRRLQMHRNKDSLKIEEEPLQPWGQRHKVVSTQWIETPSRMRNLKKRCTWKKLSKIAKVRVNLEESHRCPLRNHPVKVVLIFQLSLKEPKTLKTKLLTSLKSKKILPILVFSTTEDLQSPCSAQQWVTVNLIHQIRSKISECRMMMTMIIALISTKQKSAPPMLTSNLHNRSLFQTISLIIRANHRFTTREWISSKTNST